MPHDRSRSHSRDRRDPSSSHKDEPTGSINNLSSSSSSHHQNHKESSTARRSRSRSRDRDHHHKKDKDDKHRPRDKHHRDDKDDRSRKHRSRSRSYSGSSYTGTSDSSRSSSRHRSHHRHHHHHSKRHKYDRKEKKEKKSKREHRSHSPEPSHHRDSKSQSIIPPVPINTSTTTTNSALLSSTSLPSSTTATHNSDNRILGLFGYTAENNPYGDPNLNTPFLWGKKVQKDITTGKTTSIPTTAELTQKRDTMMDEIERARERRSKREAEREEMERLRAEEARLKDANQYAGWEEKEEEFHRNQIRTRILIRIKEQRERMSDALVKNPMVITAILDGKDIDEPFLLTEIQLRPPLRTIQNCYSINDLESIINDIKDVQEYEGPNGLHALYWSLILDVVQDELRRRKAREIGLQAGRSLDSLTKIEEEIDAMFEGQNEESLDDMEKQIRNTLHTAANNVARRHHNPQDTNINIGGAIDTEYWEGVLKNLYVARAKLILQRLHEELIIKRLTQMEAVYAKQNGLSDIPRLETLVIPRDIIGRRTLISKKLDLLRSVGLINSTSYYEDGTNNNTSSSSSDKESTIPEGEDASFVDETGRVLPTGMGETAMGDDLEVAVPVNEKAGAVNKRHPDYDPLLEKFRPRKPRYFNRIKTGYDWNRYNQAHYDRDNPPPKTVQGYKFNIFYPDLLDRTKTPSFHLEPADTDDYVLIRFHGGPPYEDIAFKIVNREWDRGKKSGFRSTFDRGILQLYFNFRRYRYRK